MPNNQNGDLMSHGVHHQNGNNSKKNSSDAEDEHYYLLKIEDSLGNLSKMNKMKFTFDPNWTAEEVWQQGMVCFEHHQNCVIEFLQLLPGYSKLCPADRVNLFGASVFPITVAQLSLDYDVDTGKDNYLSMDENGRELMVHFFPQLKALRESVQESGQIVKKAAADNMEIGLLAAVLFFNSDISGLVDSQTVKENEEEYEQAVSSFYITKKANNDKKAAQEYIAKFYSLVRYFIGVNEIHNRVLLKFARAFPSFAKTSSSHYELFTKRFQS